MSSVGSLQVCAGCESIMHAMHIIYKGEISEPVLQFHTFNSFNSVLPSQHSGYMPSYWKKCPKLLQTTLPTVREITSPYRITQGKPTSMAICAIAIISRILMLIDITHQDDLSTKTDAYAYDFNAAGKITQLENW